MATIPFDPEPQWLARMQDTADAVLETTGQAARLALGLYAATLEAFATGQRQAANETDITWVSDLVEAGADVTEQWARAVAWALQQLP